MTQSPTVTIRVRGYSFSVSAPYSPGQPLGEAEALHLNDLRADNIRNNLTKPVLDAIGALAPGQLLAPATLAELQAKFTTYDAGYRLQLKHQARPRVGAIEAEARAIAEERLEAQIRQSGQAPDQATYERWLEDFIALPEVQELARRQLVAKQRVITGTLEDLLG